MSEIEHYMDKVTAVATERDRHEREAADWQRWCHDAEGQRDEAIALLRRARSLLSDAPFTGTVDEDIDAFLGRFDR